ncbi:MAG: C-type lectin domain-containing protein, partial [Phycisphaerales bacterium]
MREPGVRQPAGEPVGQRKSPAKGAEIVRSADAATLRAVARSMHRGAWWRAVRREGWSRAPGVARALGILAVLSCLVAGGGVSLPGPLGLFRGGEIREGAVDRASDAATLESPSGMEIDAMRAMKLSAAVIGVALSGSGALAQSAVEWKVSEGGNGHWYAINRESQCWSALQELGSLRGAHLASLVSREEAVFVGSLVRTAGIQVSYVGGSRMAASDMYSGWTWITGEPFVPGVVLWMGGNPGCCAPDEYWLCVNEEGRIGDVQECGFVIGGGGVIEWSADCNGDGIVDYGQ